MSKYYDRVDEATSLLVDDDILSETRRKPPVALTDEMKEYRSRWLSIRLIYVLTFMNYISYTATLASLWAYLKVLEPSATPYTMGWVVSAYAMGQVIAGPLFGLWSNRRSIKEALVVSLLFNLLAYLFYMYLASLPHHRGYYMIAARWLIGFSSASIPLSRTYIANATNLKERTSAIANANICGAVGFILGPLLQAALVPISYPGPVESRTFHFNMYTAPILLSAIVTFITAAMIIFVFREHSVLEEIAQDAYVMNTYKEMKVDYVAAIACIVLFFNSFFNFAFLETIIVPLIMHMFAWTKTKATLVQSLAIAGTALLSILVYTVIKWLSKRIKERTLLLLGFLVIVASYLVIIPWGNVYPKIQMADLTKSAPIHHTTTMTPSTPIEVAKSAGRPTTAMDIVSTIMESVNFYPSSVFGVTSYYREDTDTNYQLHPELSHNIDSETLQVDHTSSYHSHSNDTSSYRSHDNHTTTLGCPWQYAWCQTVPVIQMFQFVLCLMLFGVGYPTTNVLTISIFSKILGPKPMGLWMGFLIASGCLAGIVSPVLQSAIYDNYGPRITFVAVAGFMGTTILLLVGFFSRLRPYGDRRNLISVNINNKG